MIRIKAIVETDRVNELKQDLANINSEFRKEIENKLNSFFFKHIFKGYAKILEDLKKEDLIAFYTVDYDGKDAFVDITFNDFLELKAKHYLFSKFFDAVLDKNLLKARIKKCLETYGTVKNIEAMRE
jgi:hypothetical protein